MLRTVVKRSACAAVGAPAAVAGGLLLHEQLRSERLSARHGIHLASAATAKPSDKRRAVVLGGGIVGVASAYFLAKDGFSVTVLERAPNVACGTSAASGCLLSISSNAIQASPAFLKRFVASALGGDSWLSITPKALMDFELWRWGLRFVFTCFSPEVRHGNQEFLRQHSPYLVNLVRDIAEKEGFAGDYCASRHGMLTIFGSKAGFEAAAKGAAGGFQPLTPEEAFQHEPMLRTAAAPIAGAMFCPTDEHGDCGMFARCLAKVCQRMGVRFVYSAEVVELRMASSEGVEAVESAVLANGDEIAGDLFVVSMGSQSPRLVRPLGIDLPIYPIKGYSLELPAALANGSAAKYPIVFRDQQLGLIPLGDRLRFSGVGEVAGWDEWDATPSVTQKFRGDVEGLFPELTQGGILDSVKPLVGGRPTTPDDLPIVSGTRIPNLLVNAGHCMRGWRTACGSAAVLASLVSGRPAPDGIDTSKLSLERFKTIWRG
eukprot:TRINITY_DN36121_c0_g1_i1.p1 TRINITY_DN36121_c0_g1~~TRINITY_DN36121_c0_g1_i1.p1  ORF type:complete len:488 (-),score=94.67 TRINITY_DN36121_c0_g1_i1:183-1646(-)